MAIACEACQSKRFIVVNAMKDGIEEKLKQGGVDDAGAPTADSGLGSRPLRRWQLHLRKGHSPDRSSTSTLRLVQPQNNKRMCALHAMCVARR